MSSLPSRSRTTQRLGTASIESLVSLIAQECGQPSDLTKDDYGALTRAYWVTKRFSVVVRAIPIQALASEQRNAQDNEQCFTVRDFGHSHGK